MSRSLKVEVNPQVFKWLRVSSGWSIEDVSKRLKTSIEVVESIEKGERHPTLRQLKELSNAYKRPLAAFLLSKPLDEPPLPKDYRMLPDKKNVFDKDTIYAIRKARNLQEIGGELLININDELKPKIKKVTTAKKSEDIALFYREKFGLTIENQKKIKNSRALYNHLRDIFEDLNILVFQFSMPIEDARGFVLTDKIPNVIVVNSKDSIEARIFTLIHEFGHILLGETVIDIPDITISNNKIEYWCNQFSSSFLLPKQLSETLFKSNKETTLTDTKTLNKLSRKYKLSKGMLLYNMLKQDFITKSEYERKIEQYKPLEIEKTLKETKKKEKQSGGIPQDIRCLSEVGNKFVSIVANNYDRNYITYTDALNFLSVKSRNFDKVLAKARK
jgi:Zn-dependent peptidase ImmA (M78 family)